MRGAVLLAIALAALGLGAGPASALAGLPLAARDAASAAPAALVEAAEALSLAVPPADAPKALVGTVVQVVQPVLAPPEPVVAEAPAQPLLAEDFAAIEAEVAPVLPAGVGTEAYAFPRDEPVPPLAAPPAPAPVPAPPARAQVQPQIASAPASALGPEVAAGAAALLFAAALYVRLAPAEVLASPTRRRAFEAVRADPGCTVNTVARALGIDYKTAQHHLRVLRRSGFVATERLGGWERYFVNGALPHAGHGAAVVLRAPAARALASALAERGAARAADLARSLGVSEATASVQLRRLQAAGLAQRGADGLWAAA